MKSRIEHKKSSNNNEIEEKMLLQSIPAKKVDSPVRSMLTLSSNRLATGHKDGNLRIWHVDTNSELNCINTIKISDGSILGLAELADGSIISLARIDLITGRNSHYQFFCSRITSATGGITSGLHSVIRKPSFQIIQGKYLVMNSDNGESWLKVIDTSTKAIKEWRPTDLNFPISFNEKINAINMGGSKLFLSFSTSLYSININDLLTENTLHPTLVPTSLLTSGNIAISKNDLLIIANRERISIYDLEAQEGKKEPKIINLVDPIENLAVLASEENFVVSDKKSLKIFNINTEECVEQFLMPQIEKLCVLPDDRLISFYTVDKTNKFLQLYVPFLDAKIKEALADYIPPKLSKIVREYAGTFFAEQKIEQSTEIDTEANPDPKKSNSN